MYFCIDKVTGTPDGQLEICTILAIDGSQLC